MREQIKQSAINRVDGLRSGNEVVLAEYKDKKRALRLHEIEWHRKLALSMACLVLFMIGAPLGSIIRKGGLGSPLIFSIVFFMVFYFLGTTGEKFAKEGAWLPIWGMWFSTIVLVPVGIFLTYKAMRDSQVFNKDYYSRLLTTIRSLGAGRKKRIKEAA
jgi:lipopolysaccharide export system permease protein